MAVQNIACWGNHLPGLLKNQFYCKEIIDGWLCETAAKELDDRSAKKCLKQIISIQENMLDIMGLEGGRSGRVRVRLFPSCVDLNSM